MAGAVYALRYCGLGLIAIVVGVIAMSDLALGVAGLAVLMFFEVIPGVSNGSLSKPYGLVLVLSWLGSMARKERMPLLLRERPVLAFLLMGFVIWSGASALWASDPGAAKTRAVQLALVVTLFFVVYSAVRTEKDFLLIVWAFLTGASLVCIDSILNSHLDGGRLTTGILDPNYLAATLACSVVVASFLLLGTTGLARVVLFVYIGVDFIALALTESRGGLIAAGAALLAACVVAGPVRTQVIAFALVLAAAGLVYFAVIAPASAPEHRITTISTASSSGRTDEWNIALRMASQHPLTGVGIGNFQSVENRYLGGGINLITAKEDVHTALVVHNTYLELLAEIGVIGLALFLGIVVTTIVESRCGSGIRAHCEPVGARYPDESLTARGLVAGAVGLLAAYTFLSGEYEKELWLVLALLATIPNVARAELERQADLPVRAGEAARRAGRTARSLDGVRHVAVGRRPAACHFPTAAVFPLHPRFFASEVFQVLLEETRDTVELGIERPFSHCSKTARDQALT